MKSIIVTLVAATALWLGGTFTSSADAQYRGYRGGYSYSAPRYYRPNYGPRYYSYPNRYYSYPNRYYRPYYGNYYYSQPYYYARPYRGGYYY